MLPEFGLEAHNGKGSPWRRESAQRLLRSSGHCARGIPAFPRKPSSAHAGGTLGTRFAYIDHLAYKLRKPHPSLNQPRGVLGCTPKKRKHHKLGDPYVIETPAWYCQTYPIILSSLPFWFSCSSPLRKPRVFTLCWGI